MAKTDEFVMPGIKPILELLGKKPELAVKVYCKKSLSGVHAKLLAELCHDSAIPVEYADDSLLNSLCANQRDCKTAHQGAVAVLRQMQEPPLG